MLRQISTTLILGAIATTSFAGISDGDFEAASGAWQGLGTAGVASNAMGGYNGLLAPQGDKFGYGNSNAIGALIRNSAEVFASNETTVSFLYNFFTDEIPSVAGTPFNDRFELKLRGANGFTKTYLIADVYSSALGNNLRPQDNVDAPGDITSDTFAASTGWLTANIDISDYVSVNAGIATNVIFQVFDAGDDQFKSGFGVDTIEAVPEPGTMAGLALGAMAFARRRRNAK